MSSVRESIFFVSDLHLGAPSQLESLTREKHFVSWLEHIRDRASELILLGDVFDFWFEYGEVVPKGYVRLLGKLAELADSGIQLHIFPGNHDLWFRDYLNFQLGATIHQKPVIREFYGEKYYFAHGDGLGPGDHGYKFIKKIFMNPVCKWLFRKFHPDYGIRLARFFSNLSKSAQKDKDGIFYGEKEFLYSHSREVLQTIPDIRRFVFGHRHLPKRHPLNEEAECIFLGDWIRYFTYLEINRYEVELKSYPLEDPIPSDRLPA